MFREPSPISHRGSGHPARSPGVRARACLAATLAATTLACAPLAASAEPPDINAHKADMLGNMAKFVQWPDAIMVQNKGQIVVAVLGEDDLAAAIASVLSTRSVNGKPVFVRFARRAQDVRGCQIVYIATSQMSHAAEVEEVLRGSPTLTLADSAGFASRGGMVNFSGSPQNLRFEICLARAQQAGLKISSKLLALAHVVEPVN
jgi:hypothetical protein